MCLLCIVVKQKKSAKFKTIVMLCVKIKLSCDCDCVVCTPVCEKASKIKYFILQALKNSCYIFLLAKPDR